MQRHALTTLVAALTFAAAVVVFAQDGDLSGVTMRVVDDLSSIDAVVIVLDTSSGQAAP